MGFAESQQKDLIVVASVDAHGRGLALGSTSPLILQNLMIILEIEQMTQTELFFKPCFSVTWFLGRNTNCDKMLMT